MCGFQGVALQGLLTKINLMNIHQLSIRYQLDQDRILLSLNTTQGHEIEVWLTRRLLIGFWPVFNRVVLDHFAVAADAKSDGFVDLKALDNSTRQLLAQQRSQELLQGQDFATPYKTGAKEHPLGNAPLLLTEISLTPSAQGQLHITFTEQLAGGPKPRAFNLDLPSSMVFSLLKLMHHALAQSHWDQMPMPRGTLTEPASPLEAGERPLYLN